LLAGSWFSFPNCSTVKLEGKWHRLFLQAGHFFCHSAKSTVSQKTTRSKNLNQAKSSTGLIQVFLTTNLREKEASNALGSSSTTPFLLAENQCHTMWLIIHSHTQELFPVFRSFTVPYRVLCWYTDDLMYIFKNYWNRTTTVTIIVGALLIYFF